MEDVEMRAGSQLLGPKLVVFAAETLVLTLGFSSTAHSQIVKRGSVTKKAAAKQSDDVRSTAAFAQYAQIQVQLELLANPATAGLPISVTFAQPGQLNIGGRVPSTRLRQYVLSAAKRISGLKIVDEIQSGEVGRDFASLPKSQLETLSAETVQSLFPELAPRVRVTVKDDGIVALNGTVPSCEQKLTLSQSLKSQPGCKAVVNLLQVDVDSATGELAINEDRSQRIKANRLPSVAPAPLVDLSSPDSQLSVRDLTARKPLADDSPDGEIIDRQLREDVRNQIEANAELAGIEVQIEAHDGVVMISGELKNRVTVEKIVDTASNAAGAKKIVAKCTPYSIQRSLVSPHSKTAKADTVKESTKLLGFIPWTKSGETKVDASVANSRSFREGIRKTLKKRCEGRFEKIAVNNTLHGLVIEGEVVSARDRTFVLKQIDNTVELRSVNYDVAIRMKDAK